MCNGGCCQHKQKVEDTISYDIVLQTLHQKNALFAFNDEIPEYSTVVSELTKVVWPTRKQLTTYTSVVLVFVTFIIAVVSLIDLVLTKIVFWVFG